MILNILSVHKSPLKKVNSSCAVKTKIGSLKTFQSINLRTSVYLRSTCFAANRYSYLSKQSVLGEILKHIDLVFEPIHLGCTSLYCMQHIIYFMIAEKLPNSVV